MAEREKVIRGLECCVRDVRGKAIRPCDDCPYDNDGLEKPCQMGLMTDALALLREQEPMVMDAEEVARLTEETYQWLWIEEIQTTTWNLYCLRTFVYSKHPDTGEFYILASGYRDTVKLEGDEYGKTWRCWTSRPNEQVRRDTPWES